MTKGYDAKSFKGIPIAIEHHIDGSVTICKEVLDEINEALGHPPQAPDVKRIRKALEAILGE